MQGLSRHCSSQKQTGVPATHPVGKALKSIRPLGPSYLGGPRKRLSASQSRYDLPVREHHADVGHSAEQEQPLLSHSNGSDRSRIEETLRTLDFLCTPASDQHRESSGNEDSTDEVQVDQGPANPLGGRAVYKVVRLDAAGNQRDMWIKRRDLLRENRLQPRDLRRLDPSLSPTKTSPNITVKENVLIVYLGGVRAVIAADQVLVFEPTSPSSRRFLKVVVDKLDAYNKARLPGRTTGSKATDTDEDVHRHPFELEMLEGALIVATESLEKELVSVSKRVSKLLRVLPSEITPVNLEELRRVKQALVELESKADALRDMLEEIMDDEDEVRDMNLSSRPLREERQKRRDRERIEWDVEREREALRKLASLESLDDVKREDLVRAAQLYASFPQTLQPQNRGRQGSDSFGQKRVSPERDRARSKSSSSSTSWPDSKSISDEDPERSGRTEAALEELEDAEEEKANMEEVEDLLEYYLQRATTTQSEAQRLLDGARDLEESISVSLSARRFEVNRLELTLSIGNFAAAIGAVVAGIFGMNLRSTIEHSVVGFWGTSAGIVLGCLWVCFALFSYTRRRRIL